MTRTLFLLFITFILNTISPTIHGTEDLKKNIAHFIPEPFNQIIINKSRLKEVTKILGKAALVEKNKHYFIVNNFKYAVEIIYKKNIVSELSYTFTKEHPFVNNTNFPLHEELNRVPSSVSESDRRHLEYSDKSGEMIVDQIDYSILIIRLK